MSNTEPDAGGTQNFFRSLFQRNTQINAMAGSEIKIAGLEEATQQMSALNNELKGLVQSLTGLSQQQATLTAGISNTMKSIASNAQQTSSAVEGVTGSMGRFRSGAMSIASIFGSAVNSNFVKDLAMFPLRYITGATEQARNLSMGVSTTLGGQMYATGQGQEQLMRTLSNFPGGVRGGVEDIIGLQAIMRQSGAMMEGSDAFWGRGQRNPRVTGFLESVREMQAMTPGIPVAQLAQTVGGYASNVQAQQQSAYLTGGAFAMIGAGGHQKSVSEWAEGILRWLEGQRPGDNRGKGFNYGELLAQYFPGSNIDAWLSQQGVPEGMKEYFWNYALAKSRMTGSTTENILPETGALASRTAFKVAPMQTGGNQAWGRLEAATAQSRGQFRLGGALTGMFTNKETANTWFNEIIAQIMSEVIPKQIAGGSLQAMGVLPDPIQELLMTFLERSGTVGAAIGGYLGYGVSGLSNINAGLFQQLFAGGLPEGALGPESEQNLILGGFGANPNASGLAELQSSFVDWWASIQGQLPENAVNEVLPPGTQPGGTVGSGGGGDVGDAWTSRGNTSPAGLHPSVRRGIERMMGDNPRLRVTSGLRDTVQQRRLRAAGNENVSGKPSAHTRGLAADLGPRSEYPWIVANASKYGLKSGASHGEPWHVGLPGIGDIGRGIGDPRPAVDPVDPNDPNTPVIPPKPGTTPVTPETTAAAAGGTTGTAAARATADDSALGLGGLFGLFTEGVTKQGAIDVIGSLVPTLLNLFLGAFGGTAANATIEDMASIAYDPGLYRALRKAAGGPEGIITLGGTFTNTYTITGGYVGGGGGGGSSGPWDPEDQSRFGGTPAEGAASPRAIYDYLKQQGVSAASAAGILANIQFESNFDPTNASGDGGTSGGLFQHHAGRWANLKQYAADTGRDWTDWHAQVDFALKEAREQYNIDLNSSDPAAAAKEWCYEFEVPANASIRAAERAAVAPNYMFGDIGDAPVDPYSLYSLRTMGDVQTGMQGTGASALFSSATRLPKTTRVYPSQRQALGDFDDQAGPALSMQSKPSQNVVFNNTFNINGGGGQGGGIDVRRTVTMLAEQLEGEMNKRLARTN